MNVYMVDETMEAVSDSFDVDLDPDSLRELAERIDADDLSKVEAVHALISAADLIEERETHVFHLTRQVVLEHLSEAAFDGTFYSWMCGAIDIYSELDMLLNDMGMKMIHHPAEIECEVCEVCGYSASAHAETSKQAAERTTENMKLGNKNDRLESDNLALRVKLRALQRRYGLTPGED